jgi:hypothetical protein
MEKFLLSADGETARNRFCELCRDASADEALSLICGYTQYAGFHFTENKAFASFSLEEKANFLKPYSSRLETNNNNLQRELLRVWANDPEWNNPERKLPELTLLALRKRHLFSFNMEWLFTEVQQVILRRVRYDSLNIVEKNHSWFLEKVDKGKFISNEEYPEDFKKPSLLFATLAVLAERYNRCEKLSERFGESSWWTYQKAWEQLNGLFFAHLARCLPSYNTEDACQAIVLAKAGDDYQVMSLILNRDLSLEQISMLLRQVGNKTKGTSIVSGLQEKLVGLIKGMPSDKDCLETAINFFFDHKSLLKLETILQPAFDRKSFRDLMVLLDTLQEVIEGPDVEDERSHRYIPDGAKEAVRQVMQNRVESCYNSPEEALLFCFHKVFSGSTLSWRWYYGRYPLKKLGELDLLSLDKNSLATIFSEGKPREHLLAMWKATPFHEISLQFMFNFNLKLHEHPEWDTMSLKDRLALFNQDNVAYHKKMLVSLAQDFEKLWVKEKWTVEQYLKEIERATTSYEADSFAALAVGLI